MPNDNINMVLTIDNQFCISNIDFYCANYAQDNSMNAELLNI